jgi:hypothetical protein
MLNDPPNGGSYAAGTGDLRSRPPFDLCAPSQFAGPADWGRAYAGTSTACALTAGALALARSFPATKMLTAAALHARATATVSPVVHETVPNERLGSGLLNIDALL